MHGTLRLDVVVRGNQGLKVNPSGLPLVDVLEPFILRSL